MSSLYNPYANSWALLIGVNEYEQHPELPDLDYAVRDVKAMADMLVDLDFGRENIILLNHQVTQKEVQAQWRL